MSKFFFDRGFKIDHKSFEFTKQINPFSEIQQFCENLQSLLKKFDPHCVKHGAGEELRSVFPWANFRVLISDLAFFGKMKKKKIISKWTGLFFSKWTGLKFLWNF